MDEDVFMGKQCGPAELRAYDSNPRLFMVAMSVSRGNVERKKFLRQAALCGTQAKAEAWPYNKKWKKRAVVHDLFHEPPIPASLNEDGCLFDFGVAAAVSIPLHLLHDPKMLQTISRLYNSRKPGKL
jgi:hypothetical protein